MGSVVRSKITPMFGAGLVKEVKNDQAKVEFPKAPKEYKKNVFCCHLTTLRAVTHIEELRNERK